MKDSTIHRMEVVAGGMRIEREVFQDAVYFKQMGQRKGQALMNGLRTAAPELYEILSGSPEDPFFDDAKLDRALAILGFNRHAHLLEKN